MVTRRNQTKILYALFLLALATNFAFWLHSRHVLNKWDNVGSPPSVESAGLSGIGDREIAYRLFGYFLQNTGNVGGLYESLKKYDYAQLGKWFFLTQELDERANYVPFMAAYYFGAVEDETKDKSQIAHVVDYLASNGQLPYPQKWRWLAQAVYLARYVEMDNEKALKLAYVLAALPTDTAPWARQMPAFLQLKMGNKQAAYEVMVRMLVSEQDKLPVVEVNEMKRFICTRALDPAEAAKNPLCQDAP